MIPHKNPAIRIIRSMPCSLTSFIYNVQPSPIFLSACAITRFLRFERVVSVVKRRNIGRCLPSSARSAQKDIRETSFPAIFLPIPPGSLSVLSIFPPSSPSLPFPLRLSFSQGWPEKSDGERERGWEKEGSPKR